MLIEWLPSNITHVVLFSSVSILQLPKNIQFLNTGSYAYKNFIFGKYLKYYNSILLHKDVNTINKNLDTLILRPGAIAFDVVFSKNIRIVDFTCKCTTNGEYPKRLIKLALICDRFNHFPKNLIHLDMDICDEIMLPENLKQLTIQTDIFSEPNLRIYDNLPNSLSIIQCRENELNFYTNKPNRCTFDFGFY